MFDWIYHGLLEVSHNFSACVPSYFDPEASYLPFLFRLGRGSVLLCVLPWLQTLLSRHMSSIVSQESSLVLLNSLYQVSIYFVYQLQRCTDLKWVISVKDVISNVIFRQ